MKFFKPLEIGTRWYKLDNAAKIFPFMINGRNTTVFRFSATLTENVNYGVLRKALHNIMARFPYYHVLLKSGLFWYYLEETSRKPEPVADLNWPCRAGDMKRGNFPFRVMVYFKKLSVEFTHALTDGFGALSFLRALVCEYFSVKGVAIKDWLDVMHTGQIPDTREFEDSYVNHYRENLPKPPKQTVGFNMPFRADRTNAYRAVTGIVQTDKLLALAKAADVTMTELLAALYMDCLQEIRLVMLRRHRRLSDVIRVTVPVNLRRMFNSITMRNFVLYVVPEINTKLGHYTFEELLHRVHHTMKLELTEKNIDKLICRNVNIERMISVRLAPALLKNAIVSPIALSMGESLFSGCVTNMGNVILPDEVMPFVERFEFLPSPAIKYKNTCGVISFKDKIYITFTRVIKESLLEEKFFGHLVKMGIKVKIESNTEDANALLS